MTLRRKVSPNKTIAMCQPSIIAYGIVLLYPGAFKTAPKRKSCVAKASIKMVLTCKIPANTTIKMLQLIIVALKSMCCMRRSPFPPGVHR